MVSDKTADIAATGADTVLAGDLGCLLNIAGKLSRRGSARRGAPRRRGARRHDRRAPPIGAPGAMTRDGADQPRLSSANAHAGARPTRRCSGRWASRRTAFRCGAPQAIARLPGVRGAARRGHGDQGPHARASRFLSRALRAEGRSRPAARCIGRATPRRRATTVLDICRSVGAKIVTKGKIDDRRGDRAQRSPRGERHHAGRDRSRRIHHPAAPRAAEPHHRAGDPSDEGAGRRRPSAPRTRELDPDARR